MQQGNIKKHEAYGCWKMMLNRCNNKNANNYKYYGGRGICVCKEWTGKGGFEAFAMHIGTRPSKKHSIDRFPDKNGDYKPGNVRWADQGEQTRNQRRNLLIGWKGKTQTLADWAQELDLSYTLLHQRFYVLGHSPERAFTQPAKRNAKGRGKTKRKETNVIV